MVKAATKPSDVEAQDPVINVILQLKGEDATRLLRYEEREKLRAHATAAYKLMFERLDQVESARAESVAETPNR